MQNSGPLVPFGLAVIALTAVLIVVPYLRGKSDALTAWNVFLLGVAIFIGVGCLEVAYGYFHWPELQWFQPTRGEIQRYMLGASIFYATLLFTYYKFPLARSIGAKVWNKWPPVSVGMLLFVLAICLILSAAAFASTQAVFLGPFVRNVSHKGAVFATVFSFCFWYRDRRNPLLLALFLGVLCYACLFAMMVFGGRRLLLSVASSPLICLYWLRWRHLSPKSNLVRLGLATMVALGVTAFYSTIRHYRSQSEERATFARLAESLHSTGFKKAVQEVSGNTLHYFSQYSAHYSLLTMRLVDDGTVPVEPLNSLAYVFAYPIPRAIWSNKPTSLGGPRLINDILHMPYHTNWGLGAVGDGYQEGGMAVIALYGFLAALGIRILDDAMRRQPDNVFLLAILCASAPHLVAWARGEVSIMTTEILEAFLFAWGLSLMCRFLFGTVNSTNMTGSPNHVFGHRRAPAGLVRK